MMLDKYYKILTQLLNKLIKNGKKQFAFKIFKILLYNIYKESKKNSISSPDYIEIVLKRARPILGIQKFWKKRKFYYLPKIINREQEIKIALKWLIKSSNSRKEKKLHQRLTNEILDCYKGTGSTLLKKQNLYDMLIESRPFLNLLIYK